VHRSGIRNFSVLLTVLILRCLAESLLPQGQATCPPIRHYHDLGRHRSKLRSASPTFTPWAMVLGRNVQSNQTVAWQVSCRQPPHAGHLRPLSEPSPTTYLSIPQSAPPLSNHNWSGLRRPFVNATAQTRKTQSITSSVCCCVGHMYTTVKLSTNYVYVISRRLGCHPTPNHLIYSRL
jgi:hypothetical protein